MMFLVNQETVRYLYPTLAVLSGIAWGGVGIATFNLQFKYAPLTGRTIYLGANASLGGLTGFGAVLASSALLGVIGPKIQHPFGFHFGGMQVIFAVSGFLLAGCALFVHLCLRKKF
jgi:MFS family permease